MLAIAFRPYLMQLVAATFTLSLHASPVLRLQLAAASSLLACSHQAMVVLHGLLLQHVCSVVSVGQCPAHQAGQLLPCDCTACTVWMRSADMALQGGLHIRWLSSDAAAVTCICGACMCRACDLGYIDRVPAAVVAGYCLGTNMRLYGCNQPRWL